MAPPFRQAEFDIIYGQGISKVGDIVDLAVEQKLIDKSGTWYSYSDNRLGQGRENVKSFLIENPKIMEEIENRIKQNLGFLPPQKQEVKRKQKVKRDKSLNPF